MSFPRQMYEFMKAASIAHAKWDYEVSMSIIKNRKKLLVLLILVAADTCYINFTGSRPYRW